MLFFSAKFLVPIEKENKNLVPIEKLSHSHSNGIESISTSFCSFMLTFAHLCWRIVVSMIQKSKLRTTKKWANEIWYGYLNTSTDKAVIFHLSCFCLTICALHSIAVYFSNVNVMCVRVIWRLIHSECACFNTFIISIV